MKKVLSILAASAMLAIVACGGETKTEAPATEAPVTEEVAVDTAAMAVDTSAMQMDTTAAPAN